MIVPSARLLWLVTLAGLPLAVAGALAPGYAGLAAGAGAALALAAITDAALWRRASARLDVEFPALVRLHKDRPASLPVHVRNPGGKARRARIGVPFPEGIAADAEDRMVEVPAGAEAAEFFWPCTPRRRGQYRVDACYLEVPSVLGLWAVRSRRPAEMEIRVYPNLRAGGSLAALRRGGPGAHALRQVGRGREFEKLRDYAPGDSFDEIHWKATARRGHPITKVFQVERTQEIYTVIDASRLSARPAGEDTTLERYLQAALLLGAAAERRGDRFGLVAFSHRIEAFVRARAGKAHYAACRDAIYQLQPRAVAPDFDDLAMFLRLRLRRRALLVFLTALDDPVLAEGFTRATLMLARQHLVLAAMAAPPGAQPLFSDEAVGAADDLYRRLGGHLLWRSLRELEEGLRRQGVRFTLLQPAALGWRLVRLYDEVKQRQLL